MGGVEKLSIALTPEFAAEFARLLRPVSLPLPVKLSAMHCVHGGKFGEAGRWRSRNCGISGEQGSIVARLPRWTQKT
jgi:hypothetical protein